MIWLAELALEAGAVDMVEADSLVGVAQVAGAVGTVDVDLAVDVGAKVERPLVDSVSCRVVPALVAVLVAVAVEVVEVVAVIHVI